MATNITTNPWPLGLLKPGAPFATASIPVTTNYADLATVYADSFTIQADPNNQGNLYLCNTAATPDLTNYTNVLSIIAPGGSSDNASSAMNTISLGSMWVGATNATDFGVALARFR